MARPIKETLELTGVAAVRFEALISNPKLVSNEEKERARKAYEIMKSINIEGKGNRNRTVTRVYFVDRDIETGK